MQRSTDVSGTLILIIGLTSLFLPIAQLGNRGQSSSADRPGPTPSTERPRDETTPQPRPDPDADLLWCAKRFLAPLAESRVANLSLGAFVVGLLDDDDAERPTVADFGGGTAKVLLATVPDPVDTGYYYHFDGNLEAIQMAFAVRRHLRDRSWLPWNDVQLVGGDYRRAQRCRALLPGVILFRTPIDAAEKSSDGVQRPTAEERFTILLLVGETPTAGIHRTALLHALRMAEWAGAADPALILGPTFSGSAQSLRQTLVAWNRGEPPHRVDILSGSVTSPTAAAILRPGPDDSRQSWMSFAATTTPDDRQTAFLVDYLRQMREGTTDPGKRDNPWRRLALVDYLRQMREGTTDPGKRDNPWRRLALISESATVYGQQEATKSAAASPGGDPGQSRPKLVIQFPPNLANVWTAYNEQETAARTSSEDAVRAPRIHLDRLRKPDAPPRHIEPDMSARTVLAHDLSLGRIVTRIRHSRVGYVGLAATNPDDVVFLARHLRQELPRVRFFTFGSDLVYTHPDLAPMLNGMLLVSPYPMLGEGPRQVGDNSLRLFASDMNVGCYNAAIVLLGKLRAAGAAPTQPGPLPPGVMERDLVSDQLMFAPGKSPYQATWVAVISNGQIWPLSHDGEYVNRATPRVSARHEHANWRSMWADGMYVRFRRPSLMALILLTLFTIGNLLVFAYLTELESGGATRVRPFFQEISDHWIPPAAGSTVLTVSHHFYVLAASLVSIGFGLVTLLLCVAHPLATPRDRGSYVVAELLVFLLLLAAWRAAMLVRLIVTQKNRDAAWFSAPLVVYGPRLALLGLVFFMVPKALFAAYESLAAMPDGVALWVNRSIPLGSGVSPLTAVLWFGFCLYSWAMSGAHRLHELDRLVDPQTLPPGRGDDGWWIPFWIPASAGWMSQDERLAASRLARVVADPRMRGWGFSILLSTVSGLLLFVSWRVQAAPLEVPAIRYSLYALMALASACVAASWARMIWYWLDLDAFTKFLAIDPIMKVFPEPSAQVDAGVASCLTAAPPSLAELQATADCATRLLNEFPPEVAVTLSSAAGRLREAWEASRDVREDPFRRSIALERALRRFAGDLTPAVTATPPEASLDPAPAPPRWVAAAQRFVADQVRLVIVRLLRQFRHLSVSLICGFIFIVAALFSYAFEPKDTVLLVTTAAAILAIAIDFLIFVQLDRNPTLSRVLGTRPGRVEFSGAFVTRFVLWVLLPVLSLVTLQFPAATVWLSKLIGPFSDWAR